jgi:hypothetical protein
VNAAVWFLTSGIELLRLIAPPCGIPTNGIVTAAIVKDLLSFSRWSGDLCLRWALASIFFFFLIKKRNKKNQGFE